MLVALFTGELIGVEYLYSQTGQTLQDFMLDPDSHEEEILEEALTVDDEEADEGFGEAEEMEDLTVPLPTPRVRSQQGREAQADEPTPSTSTGGVTPHPTADTDSQDSELEVSILFACAVCIV